MAEKVVFWDGTEAEPPKNWAKYANIKAANGPDGFFFFTESPDLAFYDRNFRALLPADFYAIPDEFYNEFDYQQTMWLYGYVFISNHLIQKHFQFPKAVENTGQTSRVRGHNAI